MTITKSQIAGMEKRYRTTLINSLPGYKCLQMVGTASAKGTTNLALFNSIFHVGANPALLGMVVRPNTPDHDTLDNIIATGCYTLNNVLPEWYQQAHQTSASYPSGVSEFDTCGFQAYFNDDFGAPFVAQSTVKIGLNLHEVLPIKINDTCIVIGEIHHLIVDPVMINEDGYIDHLKAGTVTVAGLDSYFTAQPLGRVAYAKPDNVKYN
jgi:flavin reductase (DIM6/NTAB) family NADH-FMN oxidoreductase RutF